MRRLPFLPLFFTALAIVFVIALAIRLRSPVETPAGERATVRAASTRTETVRENPEQPRILPVNPAGAGERHLRKVADASAPPLLSTPAPPAPPEPTHTVVPPPPVQRPPTTRAATIIEKAPPAARTTGERGSKASSKSDGRDTPKDPDSDTTPPQLLSVEFQPAQVHDGEEAAIIVTATDDLSGVRAVSGTMTSPSGKASQGFMEQREGATDRFVGRVAIPKAAEEGLWRVSFLNLSDNASNSVMLTYAQGRVPSSAVLRVISSRSDSTAPTLKNVWVDRRAMHSGEKNTVFVQAEDENSGVNLVSAVFQSRSKIARIGASCNHGDEDIWQCDLSVPGCVDCGDWQLEQITLQDKANNIATYRQENPLVKAVAINIAGSMCDSTAPVLQSVVLNSRNIVLGREVATVVVRVTVSDDLCGVSGVSAQYAGPAAGSGGFFPFQPVGDQLTWEGHFPLDPRSARGIWRIASVQLTDAGHNLRIVYVSDPLLQNATFQVR
jgi:hypothetical protein